MQLSVYGPITGGLAVTRSFWSRIAGRVVISADHGEAFGEWGAYGHSEYGEFEGLRQVPWVELSATDRETHDPEASAASSETTPDVAEQPEHLGYR